MFLLHFNDVYYGPIILDCSRKLNLSRRSRCCWWHWLSCVLSWRSPGALCFAIYTPTTWKTHSRSVGVVFSQL